MLDCNRLADMVAVETLEEMKVIQEPPLEREISIVLQFLPLEEHRLGIHSEIVHSQLPC